MSAEKQSKDIKARGGARPGAGRPTGSQNKATAEVRDLAREYAPAALAELARLATKAESEPARVAAIRELLDRAYGRPTAALGGPDGGPIRITWGFEEVLRDRLKVVKGE